MSSNHQKPRAYLDQAAPRLWYGHWRGNGALRSLPTVAPAVETPSAADDADETTPDVPRTIGDMAFGVLRTGFAAMVSHEVGARLGQDAKETHAIRVAIHCLRAALGLFKRFLPDRVLVLTSELSWFVSMLAPVRDLDVQIEQAATWFSTANAMDVTEQERTAQQALHALLAERRYQAHCRLLDAMESRQYARLVSDFSICLRQPDRDSVVAQSPAADILPGLLAQRYRRLRKVGDGIGPTSPLDEYHTLRIQCKRLRYSVEFASRLYGKLARGLLTRTTALQDTLGIVQDAQVAIEHLRLLGMDQSIALPPQTI